MQAIFIELRKSFRPVMRHYFTEQHTNPISWFAMRLRYTRSVATSSVVGHIVGLGDRHPSNILLHALTGEVVHIDLGIAFEQVWQVPRWVDGITWLIWVGLGQVTTNSGACSFPFNCRYG
jgi:phosphatidylinositol kinase/protein kinase (PI-3  family)